MQILLVSFIIRISTKLGKKLRVRKRKVEKEKRRVKGTAKEENGGNFPGRFQSFQLGNA